MDIKTLLGIIGKVRENSANFPIFFFFLLFSKLDQI